MISWPLVAAWYGGLMAGAIAGAVAAGWLIGRKWGLW